MINVVRFATLALAILSALVALYYLVLGAGTRRRINRQAYRVGQQEVRRAMQMNFLRAIAAVLVGLVMLVAWGVSLSVAELRSTPTPTPTAMATAIYGTPTQPATLVPTETLVVTAVSPTHTPAPTTPAATPTVTLEPSPTSTLVPLTAIVASGVGVWLRSTPGTAGEQLEWILDGTLLVLLPGREFADDFEWQQVRTPSGNEGWVAVPFIRYNP